MKNMFSLKFRTMDGFGVMHIKYSVVGPLPVCVLTVSPATPIGEINVQILIPGLSGVLQVKSV